MPPPTLTQLVRFAFRLIGTNSGAQFVRLRHMVATVRVHARMPVVPPDPANGRTIDDVVLDVALFLWHQVACQCKIYGIVHLGHVRLIQLRVQPLSPKLFELRLILGVY